MKDEQFKQHMKELWPHIARIPWPKEVPVEAISMGAEVTHELFSDEELESRVQELGGYLESKEDSSVTFNTFYASVQTSNDARELLKELQTIQSCLALALLSAPSDPNHPDYRHEVASVAVDNIRLLFQICKSVGVPPQWHIQEQDTKPLNTCKDCP